MFIIGADPSTAGARSSVDGHVDGSSSGGMEATAQELFRVVFFIVHYVEVWLLGRVPNVGKAEVRVRYAGLQCPSLCKHNLNPFHVDFYMLTVQASPCTSS